MNQLAHFLLPFPNQALMAGGYLGDHVKGRLVGEFPADIEAGIHLHRKIDVFTDQHPVVKQSLSRFKAPHRRYAGIICDVMFDYYLANHWRDYCALSLVSFCQQAYESLLHSSDPALVSYKPRIERMQQQKVLERYQDKTFIEGVLTHLGTRLKRDNPMATAFSAATELEQALEQDFFTFMPELQTYVGSYLALNDERTKE